MSDATLPAAVATRPPRSASRARGESLGVQIALIAISLAFLLLFLLLPLVTVFVEAGAKGWQAYRAAIVEPDALAAIRLTLLVAAIAVPFNIVVGIAAAWAVAKFEFRGKNLLISLIDLPFSVSPVISGLVFVLLFGAQGYFGPWLQAHDLKIVFALPGLGRLVFQAIAQHDLIVVKDLVMLFAGLAILINFAVELLYGLIDPRLRQA